MEKSGYLHPKYAQSLSEFGVPLELPASRGWILKRSIPETSQYDGMGCYPIFACENWSVLRSDLKYLSSQVISVSLVTDPFGDYTQAKLREYFKDVVMPYKYHYVVDLNRNPDEFVSRHHKRNVRQALKINEVEFDTRPVKLLSNWVSLYDVLIKRHNIKGISRFSREAFLIQLGIPGIVATKAIFQNKVAGMLLWYVQGDVAYYHLGAYSLEGYREKSSFAMFWKSIEYFSDMGINWLSLGTGAGLQAEADGLTRFKSGWATDQRIAYFCGHIFDRERYNQIAALHQMQSTDYFPAYRAGEFV